MSNALNLLVTVPACAVSLPAQTAAPKGALELSSYKRTKANLALAEIDSPTRQFLIFKVSPTWSPFLGSCRALPVREHRAVFMSLTRLGFGSQSGRLVTRRPRSAAAQNLCFSHLAPAQPAANHPNRFPEWRHGRGRSRRRAWRFLDRWGEALPPSRWAIVSHELLVCS